MPAPAGGAAIVTIFSPQLVVALGLLVALIVFVIGVRNSSSRLDADALPAGFLGRVAFVAVPGLAGAIGFALTMKLRAVLDAPGIGIEATVIALIRTMVVSMAGGELGARAARVAGAIFGDRDRPHANSETP